MEDLVRRSVWAILVLTRFQRLFDVSKQVAGQMFIHGTNLLVAGLTSHNDLANACVSYFLNILIDTTLGEHGSASYSHSSDPVLARRCTHLLYSQLSHSFVHRNLQNGRLPVRNLRYPTFVQLLGASSCPLRHCARHDEGNRCCSARCLPGALRPRRMAPGVDGRWRPAGGLVSPASEHGAV